MVTRMPEPSPASRRPLTSRDTAWARRIAGALARGGTSPDHISALSVVFALGGAAALVWLPAPAGPLLAALGTQLRLLCNLFDGMVAVEGGRGGPTGPLWNEFPDRVADSLLIIALGVAAGSAVLGLVGALLAALTAYVRVSGAALGLAQDFSGLMRKPRRMAVLTLACVVAAAAPWWPPAQLALLAATWIILAGSALTCAGRTRRIAAELRARAAAGRPAP
jgi:phosphatidylglycerophosphate synthase